MQLIIKRKNLEYVVLIDDNDFSLISKHKWRLKKSGNSIYVSAPIYLGKLDGKYKWKHIYLHRFLLVAKKGEYVDHKNGNTLDNRRENLRICTNQQNCCNQRIRKNNKTGVKGVRFAKGKFIAQININNKSTYLGSFETLELAKDCYNTKAKEVHKEFAQLNA